MCCFFKFMAEYGIWDIAGLFIAIIPFIVILWYFFPKKSMKGLNIHTSRDAINATYPKVVRITITNTEDEPVYIKSEGFKFGNNILPSPNGARNVETDIYEVKFDGRNQPGILTEFDFLVRRGDPPVSTWVPVEPNQTDANIDAAIRAKQVGSLNLKCQRISARRNKRYSLALSI